MFIVFDNSEKHKKAKRIEEKNGTITHELISIKHYVYVHTKYPSTSFS